MDHELEKVLIEARAAIMELFEWKRGEFDMGQGDEYWATQVPAVVAKIDALLS